MNTASIEFLIAIAVGLVLGLIVLLILELYNSQRISKLTYPVYEYALKRAEDEADHILAEARQDARHIVVKAETESMSTIGTRKGEIERAEREFRETLEAFRDELTARLTESTKKEESHRSNLTEKFSASLKQESAQLRERMESVFTSMEKENKKRMDEHLAQSFKHAEESVADYEHARRDLVDNHILALIGETAKIALHKELTMDAHAELVRKALEEAKTKGIF